MKAVVAKILVRLFLLSLLGAAGWLWFALSPVRHAPGVLIESDPIQSDGAAVAPPPDPVGDYKLIGLAGYHISARVLGVKRYHDPQSKLAPIDLALGWGPMSDTAALSKLSISQSNRFYFYEWKGSPPIPKDEIVRHSANVHVIPGNPEVAALLGQLKTGCLVTLRGSLVEARKETFKWRSSLRRDDTGNGACELMLVTKAELFDGDQNLAAREKRLEMEEARADLNRWYETLQKQRQSLDLNDPEAVRRFNLEGQRYMEAAHPSKSRTR